MLCFRLDWQLDNSGEKISSWSQEWSVAKDQEAVTDIFQAYESTITAGGPPVSPTGPAPTTVSNALFNSNAVTTASTITATTTPNPITPTETAAERTEGTKGNKAWIAGPVVGGIAAICLFSLGLFLYQRRRRPTAAELEGDMFQRTGDKPQLHSDHLPPRILYEMDASHAPCEADNGALPEMAADEAPARVLVADHHHLRPSEEREKHHNAQDVVKAQP